METSRQFIPNLAGCGKTARLYALSSVQKPVSELGKTHLLLRNVTEYYTAFNRAMWGSYPPDCMNTSCGGGGQASFLFDLVEAGCYRAVFRVRRYHEVPKKPIKLWFHIHEMGRVDHQEVAEAEDALLFVELGRLTAEGNYWQLVLNIDTGHADNQFAFYEAWLERLY